VLACRYAGSFFLKFVFFFFLLAWLRVSRLEDSRTLPSLGACRGDGRDEFGGDFQSLDRMRGWKGRRDGYDGG